MIFDDELPPLDDDTATARVMWEWHLNRIRWYEAKTRQVIADRDDMIRRYTEWADDTTGPWVAKCEQSEAWLEFAMLAALDADPGAPKTVKLPSGVVRSSAGRERVEVRDEQALVGWAREHQRLEMLKVTAVPVKAAILEALHDGEVVPGVELVVGARTVTVTVE